eukprot:TRINITY_DN9051_c0_g1_i1.p1 TRINITY_DN9051_c0_g1~~TRINITY_DN9051_c0_g1_i1.p1  ORF type:complete len:523 (-),score=137.24 TRINITY_DN9051_c0_g1_i1:902-2470(-)
MDEDDIFISNFMELVFQHRIQKPSMPTFGTESLDDYMHEQRAFPVHFLCIPWVIRKTVDVVLQQGLETVGIFRVPGSHTEIQNIVSEFNNGESPDLVSINFSVESVSGAFKKYMRDLPHPILDDPSIEGFQNNFVSAMEIEDEQEMIETIRKHIAVLPLFRRSMAKEMFYLLKVIECYSAVNMMTSQNIATIFGGMVEIVSSIMSSGTKTKFCKILIENYDAIFEELDTLVPNYETLETGRERPHFLGDSKGVQIFLDDGTFKALLLKDDDTAEKVISSMKVKIGRIGIDATDYSLYEVREREWRIILPGEHIVSIFESGSAILFTGKIVSDCRQKISLPTPIREPSQESESFSDTSSATSSAVDSEKVSNLDAKSSSEEDSVPDEHQYSESGKEDTDISTEVEMAEEGTTNISDDKKIDTESEERSSSSGEDKGIEDIVIPLGRHNSLPSLADPNRDTRLSSTSLSSRDIKVSRVRVRKPRIATSTLFGQTDDFKTEKYDLFIEEEEAYVNQLSKIESVMF